MRRIQHLLQLTAGKGPLSPLAGAWIWPLISIRCRCKEFVITAPCLIKRMDTLPCLTERYSSVYNSTKCNLSSEADSCTSDQEFTACYVIWMFITVFSSLQLFLSNMHTSAISFQIISRRSYITCRYDIGSYSRLRYIALNSAHPGNSTNAKGLSDFILTYNTELQIGLHQQDECTEKRNKSIVQDHYGSKITQDLKKKLYKYPMSLVTTVIVTGAVCEYVYLCKYYVGSDINYCCLRFHTFSYIGKVKVKLPL
jgi:hypothetical protein